MILLVAVSMFTFIGCEYFIKPADTYEDETKYISEIRKTIENFFSYIEYDSAYIIVENYADLCEIYECASIKPACSSIFYIKGNARDADINNIYTKEYFNSGYVIAALTKDSSGSWTFECSATKNDGEIIVNLFGSIPGASTCDIGGFLYLVPIDGVYASESIKLVKTHNPIESQPADKTTSSAETTTP